MSDIPLPPDADHDDDPPDLARLRAEAAELAAAHHAVSAARGCGLTHPSDLAAVERRLEGRA